MGAIESDYTVYLPFIMLYVTSPFHMILRPPGEIPWFAEAFNASRSKDYLTHPVSLWLKARFSVTVVEGQSATWQVAGEMNKVCFFLLVPPPNSFLPIIFVLQIRFLINFDAMENLLVAGLMLVKDKHFPWEISCSVSLAVYLQLLLSYLSGTVLY